MGGQTATRTSKDQNTGRTGERSQASARHIAGSGPHADVLDLQHAAGNRAVSHLVRSSNRGIRENELPPSARSVLNSSGQPLDPATRGLMELRFGHDFGDVRVHADAEAAESARAGEAQAYTVGRDIVFSQGSYTPHLRQGSRLLAHELAHVIQQERGGGSPPALQGGALEQHADAAASALVSGCGSINVSGASAAGLARQPLFEGLEPKAGTEPRSLRESLSLDPEVTTDWQLETEIELIKGWLAANPFDSKSDDLQAELQRLQAEDARRKGEREERRKAEEKLQAKGRSVPGSPQKGKRRLREMLNLDPAKAKDRQLGDELDLIENLLVPFGTELNDTVILEKAMELHKASGGKVGGAVLAYYDRIVAGAVGGMLAQAAAPVVIKTDPSGRAEVLARAPQVTQAHMKLQMDTALGLIEGFAKAGAVAAAGSLAAGLLMLTAAAAPAVFGGLGSVSAMTAEGATALALRLAPQLMAWAARNPYLAEAVVTATVGMALDVAETGSVNPVQLAFNLLHIRYTQLQTRTPTPAPPVSPPAAQIPPAPKPAPTLTVKTGGGQGSTPTGMLRDVDALSRSVQVPTSHPVIKNKLPANDPPTPPQSQAAQMPTSHPVIKNKLPANDPPTPPQSQAAQMAVNAPKDVPHGQIIEPAQRPSPSGQGVIGQRRGQPVKATGEKGPGGGGDEPKADTLKTGKEKTESDPSPTTTTTSPSRPLPPGKATPVRPPPEVRRLPTEDPDSTSEVGVLEVRANGAVSIVLALRKDIARAWKGPRYDHGSLASLPQEHGGLGPTPEGAMRYRLYLDNDGRVSKVEPLHSGTRHTPELVDAIEQDLEAAKLLAKPGGVTIIDLTLGKRDVLGKLRRIIKPK